jgi:hypothetical protein
MLESRSRPYLLTGPGSRHGLGAQPRIPRSLADAFSRSALK